MIESVLCHCQILSHLTTKDAAQTSVLSKRWKDLFASVPIINCLIYPQRGAAANGSFVAFIYRLLYLIGLRLSHIRKFHISFLGRRKTKPQPLVGRNIISSWISIAVSFNVQELSFRLDEGSSLPLPFPLFSCKSLTVLKLEGEFLLTVPEHVRLPCLHTLWLTDAVLYDDNSVKRLLSGCPVLEDLALNSCNVENIKVFDLSYPSLKRLDINCRGDYELILNVPNLENLEITCYAATRSSGDALNSLIEVSVNYDDVSQAKIHDIVSKACNAQKLFLRGYTMEGLAYATHSLPIFHALTYLELIVRRMEGRKSLPALLERSPCLETLILTEFRNKDKLFPLLRVPLCFSMHLKTIQLTYFQGKEEDFTFLKYILAEAKILENMKIYGIDPHSERFQMTSDRLLAFPTYSKTCKIFLGDYEWCKAYQIM